MSDPGVRARAESLLNLSRTAATDRIARRYLCQPAVDRADGDDPKLIAIPPAPMKLDQARGKSKSK
jgi:hypothetical protein